ncbi:SLAIN motif-containing protein-like isoform X2 [Synchiropus splendidus]|uniref:SLAIN motif-containing protein-like isoform X2 n=1 Tax=Synchiropus splendidus TaxID=270530 RepID=UPI00237E7742|nr:SLAIN motif-containing protein-like isoform X2 [Synchiropus splendidus]
MMENWMDKMDFQDQVSWSFAKEPLMELVPPNHHLFGSVRRAPARGCGSFAMEARMRLDQLKSGCGSSQAPRDLSTGPLWNPAHQRETPETVLDLVELLEVDDEEEDEGSWLYAPTKTRGHVDNDSALRWCRQVLDNPAPEVEAACRQLVKWLHQSKATQLTASSARLDPHGSFSPAPESLDGSRRNDPNIGSYRLQDITDVHIMARIQEASLRQELVSTPSRVPATWIGRDTQQPSHAPPAQPSPKLTRLHQQVTQFKLMKLAQNQASHGRTRPPLRTSLRSLQAVRNSRSLDTEIDTGVLAASGESPSVTSPVNLSVPVKDRSVQSPTVRRLLRSQSLSPARDPPCPRAYLPARGRVFAALTEPAASVPWRQL